MKKFKLWLEERSEITLPSIPDGFVRATNFTNPNVGLKLLSGEPFTYGRGMITSSTDAFSLNKDVINLLATGKTGSFERKPFGHHVILMDIPAIEYRKHSNPTMATGKVDNSRVLGVFDRNTNELTKNSNYNPQKEVKQMTSKLAGRRTQEPRPPKNDIEPDDIKPDNIEPDDIW